MLPSGPALVPSATPSPPPVLPSLRSTEGRPWAARGGAAVGGLLPEEVEALFAKSKDKNAKAGDKEEAAGQAQIQLAVGNGAA